MVKGIVDPPPVLSPARRRDDSERDLRHAVRERAQPFTFLKVDGGPSEASKDAVDAGVAEYPDARVQTRQEWIDKEDEEFQQFLSLLYVLLALSVIVSIAGSSTRSSSASSSGRASSACCAQSA